MKRTIVMGACGCLLLAAVSVTLIDKAWALPSPAHNTTANSRNQSESPKPWHENIKDQWGGHIKVRGSVSWPDDESVFEAVGTGPYYDGNSEGRLKYRLFFGEWGYFETHYEAVISGGDTHRKEKELEQLYPELFDDGLLVNPHLQDDRRYMDLTRTIDEEADYVLYHRLDRLSLTLLPEWGVVRVGRQAVTWGNGLLFNPMDLFNPFSPTDIERDYKTGDDMVTTQISVGGMGDFQFLYVPRRDLVTNEVQWSQSSLAAKLHLGSGTTEFDIMAAKHYEDRVVGIGSTGYVGEAAWRLDGTYTFLDEQSSADDYLSLVANMDYSWVWWEKNFYGFLEFFYNGLGDDQYSDAYADPDISKRFGRGELFTLGRFYMAAHLNVELHPLFNAYLTVINNINDPSRMLQPRAVWDIAQDVQIVFGGNVGYGGRGTEYGGYEIAGTNLVNKPANSAFLWATYFF